MPSRTPTKWLNPLLASILFALGGGLWVFSMLNYLVDQAHNPGMLRRWEFVVCLFPLLFMVGLVYALVRDAARTVRLSNESLLRVNRALTARGECSQILVRATDVQELMRGICRVIVECEGYRLAWVGFALNDTARTVLPVAQWGDEEGYLDNLSVSWADNVNGQGPTGQAIRSGRPCVAQHIQTDPKWAPWRERAGLFGIASSISLPLVDGERVFGALVIFSSEADAYDTREETLLKALADDLAYGITTLWLRKEQKRSEDRRVLLSTIVEQESDGVLTFDTRGLVQYANPAFELISGFRHDDLVGLNIWELAEKKRGGELFKAMSRALDREHGHSERFVGTRKDGSSFELAMRIFPVHGVVGVNAFAAMIRDLTHEVQLEQQLCQAQKLEAIATLADGIAHDFNNILAAIITNAEMAQDLAADDEELADHLATVLKAGLRAKSLVRQLLTLSSQRAQEPQPVQLGLVVQECVKLLRASLPSTIAINARLDDEVALVMADPTQMHQVIMNLCTNAADAMRENGGTLTIELSNEADNAGKKSGLPIFQDKDYVRLLVTDTGCGMDRKTAAMVFNPFYTTKEQGRGTGLGLSVVHGIVTNHGGEISFTSEPGEGTAFVVRLPSIDAPDTGAIQISKVSTPHGTERILFLDDEEDLVLVGQKMLEGLGYDVVSGTSSFGALEVFKSQPECFDLVITDQTMPKMTGEQLAREILRLRPDMPIILCTGLGPASIGGVNAETAREIGIREVVMKPMERTELAMAIRRALDQPAIQEGVDGACVDC